MTMSYALAPSKNGKIIGVYLYDSDDTMIRAFVNPDFTGITHSDGYFRIEKDIEELMELANEFFEEVDPMFVETIGLTQVA